VICLMNDDEEDLRDYRNRVGAVVEAFRLQPHNIINAVEKIGFTYVVDDEEGETDLTEERAAQPANGDEQALVAYFDNQETPDNSLLSLWDRLTDPQREEPNYPLWRRYFRDGNMQLKRLLLFGLEQSPKDRELLSSLSFLHEFSPMLKELIALYLRACDEENDSECFLALARDFDSNLHASGYEALMVLRERYASHALKAQLVEAATAI